MSLLEDEDNFEEGEIPDEEVPPQLQRKWDAREGEENQKIACPSCGEYVSKDSLLCLYCGNSTGVRAGIFSHLKHFFLQSNVGIVLFMIFLVIIIFFLAI